MEKFHVHCYWTFFFIKSELCWRYNHESIKSPRLCKRNVCEFFTFMSSIETFSRSYSHVCQFDIFDWLSRWWMCWIRAHSRLCTVQIAILRLPWRISNFQSHFRLTFSAAEASISTFSSTIRRILVSSSWSVLAIPDNRASHVRCVLTYHETLQFEC